MLLNPCARAELRIARTRTLDSSLVACVPPLPPAPSGAQEVLLGIHLQRCRREVELRRHVALAPRSVLLGVDGVSRQRAGLAGRLQHGVQLLVRLVCSRVATHPIKVMVRANQDSVYWQFSRVLIIKHRSSRQFSHAQCKVRGCPSRPGLM